MAGSINNAASTRGFDDKISFVWAVADELRGDFREHEYGQVMLPFLVLRRLECALEPTKAAVLAKATELQGKIENVDPILQMTSGHKFYNTSPLDLAKTLNDADNVLSNLRTYINSFSPAAVEVLEKYNFDDKLSRLDTADLLYRVVGKFAKLDLSAEAVSNDAMGYIFEELLRKFSELSNETAGEHFTPREIISLGVNLLFANDDDALTGLKPVRTIYDPACGTGGMLMVAQEHMRHTNPDAVLEAYGQELNPETWAICRSDMLIKGQDPERIKFGNSLTNTDGHSGETFDYIIANPPFGVDWKKYSKAIHTEADDKGYAGRYGAGLPRVSDGSFLFLQHMISKMKPAVGEHGGSRIAVVLSGSPLFSGSAGSGESEIRRWILENDWLEGIVALPDQLFYNTGISTYFWILTNRKAPERKGKVVLLDAREAFTKTTKSLGDKRKYLTSENIEDITQLYGNALDVASHGNDSRVKVFDREDFGYQRIRVERPKRCIWTVTDEALEKVTEAKGWSTWVEKFTGSENMLSLDSNNPPKAIMEYLKSLIGNVYRSETAIKEKLVEHADSLGFSVPDKILKVILTNTLKTDPSGDLLLDKNGNQVPDTDLSDQENIPLPKGYLDLSEENKAAALLESASSYMISDVLPYLPDAFLDTSKTKVGYEIPFTKHFYVYAPPRSIETIDHELTEVEEELQKILGRLLA